MWDEGEAQGAFVFKKNDILTTPFRWIVFVALSARSRDENTYKVCKNLFGVADTPEGVIALGDVKLGRLLYSIGFYREKTKRIMGLSKMLISKFGSEVPGTRGELMELPGVGRKTANIILNKVFGKHTLAVDVHVHRISNRLGWVNTKKPEETEHELLEILPKNLVRKANKAMVAYGQTVCLPRNPKCKTCKVRKYCKRVGVA
ncbi:MAG: endonuclease III [bacterium]|nr:endonuclease III [bacterium]